MINGHIISYNSYSSRARTILSLCHNRPIAARFCFLHLQSIHTAVQWWSVEFSILYRIIYFFRLCGEIELIGLLLFFTSSHLVNKWNYWTICFSAKISLWPNSSSFTLSIPSTFSRFFFLRYCRENCSPPSLRRLFVSNPSKLLAPTPIKNRSFQLKINQIVSNKLFNSMVAVSKYCVCLFEVQVFLYVFILTSSLCF